MFCIIVSLKGFTIFWDVAWSIGQLKLWIPSEKNLSPAFLTVGEVMAILSSKDFVKT